MNVIININRAVVIIIIIMVFLFYFLQNNSKITILTFMNVDGVHAFSQLLFWQKPAGRSVLFVDSRFINYSHYQFGKMFVATITVTSMPCKNS